jgi:serine/threonine protein kinase
MTANTFLNNLKQSRLLADDQLNHLTRLAELTPVENLPALLVSDGILTQLQAHRVASGDFRTLVLGPYHLLEEIGRGGMGRVYKAMHTVMGRLVALKLMAPELAENEIPRERFLREVRNVTRLCHPNIVLAYDANNIDGVLFLVMEYVEGTTLAELVRTQGPLPMGRACELMSQAALGLQHAYEKGLVHRDIKPANLLISCPSPAAAQAGFTQPGASSTSSLLVAGARPGDAPTHVLANVPRPGQPDEQVKIADFGLARLHDRDTVAGYSSAGFVGTPDFVAPEQCQDSHSADIRSDLYSLGCTFFFILTGRVPFPGGLMEKLLAHTRSTAPAVESLRPDVPREVAAIVARLMAKNPNDRFQTPAQLALALAPWQQRIVADGASCEIQTSNEPPDNPQTAPQQICSIAGVPAARETDNRANIGATRVIDQPDAGIPRWTSTHQSDPLPQPPADAAPTANSTWYPILGPSIASLSPTCLTPNLPSDAPELAADSKRSPTDATEPFLDVPSPSSPSPIPASFGRSWMRWTTMVEEIMRRPDLPPCDEQTYQVLYRTLLEGCAAHAKHASAQDRTRLGQLAELVQPWMSLRVLTRTEATLLQDLARQAREGGEALGLRGESSSWGLWLGVLAGLALLLVLAWKTIGAFAGKASHELRGAAEQKR